MTWRTRQPRRDARINTPGRRENWRGPHRALSLEEQLEVQRLMREARTERKASWTARELAARYGVSNRTIYRYVKTMPIPVGLEFLRMRIEDWARQRDLGLTYDDLQTLLFLIGRHRDMVPGEPRSEHHAA